MLFEDLRIEEYASRPEKLEELDIIGKSYRKMYFLRRSIATLVEFASAIEMLDQRPEFRKLKRRFNKDMQTRWDDAACTRATSASPSPAPSGMDYSQTMPSLSASRMRG